ncbi:recombinase family protein, partial [Chloroflexota bacterium]
MKAAIYARVSSERQDVDLSISAQLKALREYAERNNHYIVREFIDEAESGKTTDRPAFRDMIAQARRSAKPFDIILVWKYSRFARNREDSIVFKTMLRKAGVQVISITEPFEDTPTGRLLEAMIESLDEFYSANLGEEVTRGMRESASRGFYVASYAPYGYRKVKVNDGGRERPRLEIEDYQAQVVRRSFENVIKGKGLIDISKELNREGITAPRSNSWGKTTLHKILTNEAYTGTLVWGRSSIRHLPPVRLENAWPAIIDHDTFKRVQALLTERAFITVHPKRVASNYLLSGLAKCGYCGKSLIGQDAKGSRFHYYVCGTLQKKGTGSCPARYTSSSKLEQVVIRKIKEHILTYENLYELVRLVNEEMDTAAGDYRERLSVISAEINNVNQRLERLYDALETGSLKLADLAPRIQRLRQRQEQLHAARWELENLLSDRKVELADMETVKSYVEDLRNLLEDSPLAERKSFIKSFVREVRVTGSEVLLSYTIPLSAGGLSQETLVVPPIVHNGGPKGTRTTLCR